ncbi:CHASE domain-containing protein [Geopseudomonas sagittaria]|uniref:CHASE domain-containing protein n=1 Tax=Geopseudomonas sagittaria TaxID=1135990 RepID=UPI000B82512A|nr:CHASE domain-containing protein [Pseudomonas sagittaria]
MASICGLRKLLWQILATAGLYVLAGQAGLLLPQSSGYASPIWPAAGVAVATLLAWGWRCWPGVWLGGVVVDLWLASSSHDLGLAALAAAAVTTQALLSAWLARGYLQSTWRVSGDRGLALFLLTAGPLACLIAPTFGSALLFAGERIAADNLINEWLHWWIGDSLGVLLFAPVIHLLWPDPHPLRAPGGGFRFALPLIVTATFLALGHLALTRLEALRAQSEARTLMEVIGDGATLEITETLLPLEGLAHFIAASQQVTRTEFRAYTQSFINRPAIHSVDWAPRITHSERAGFEAAAIREGFADYRIAELDRDLRMQRAGERAEYFPILFSEPLAASRSVLGLDHGFEELRRQAMAVSRGRGKAMAADLIRLPRTDRHASLLFIPVWPLTDSGHEQDIGGYVVGAIDMQQLFAPLLAKAAERQFDLRITDVTPGSPQHPLIDLLDSGTSADWQRDLHVGGRTWRLEMESSVPLWTPGSTIEERLFLGFALLTAFLATFATLSSAERHAVISREVAERTNQLAELNAQLQQQIEEHSLALSELHAKKEEIRAILDHLLECVITIDCRGIVQSVNPAIEPMLGYTQEELLGQSVSRLMGSPLREQHDSHISRYLVTGERHIIGSNREVTGRHKDGHPIDLELSVSEYHVHGERLFIGTLRDIRERKNLIASLTLAREDAEQASRAKSAFLAAMSHEIRTPMNGVVGLIDVLGRDRLSPYQADLVKTIRDSANNLLGVIDDILDFSRIEAGRLEIERAPVPLVELINSLSSTLGPLASSRGVALEQYIAGDVPRWVCSDALRLRQILYNLIGNAIKFSSGRSERPGRVMVRAHLAGDDPLRVAIAVEDNGIGIAHEHQASLFSPFTQEDFSTTRRFGGSGLGLAICKRLATLMDGEITVVSTPGSGSIFTVTLPLPIIDAPLDTDDGQTLAPPESAVPAELAASRRILVVEDEAVNRKVIQRQLALLGYRFEMASHGVEALAMWRQGGFDLILSDLHMPEMDGYEMTERIRHEEGSDQHIPILALTANALRDEAARARASGVDDYLTKPIRLASLEAALARWLRCDATLERSTPPTLAVVEEPPLFDPNALAALVGDSPQMIREILSDYVEALGDLTPQLQDSFAGNDFDAIGALAHRLKSSSRAVGAARLGQLCAAIEQAIEDGDSTALARDIAEFLPLQAATATRIEQFLLEKNGQA